MTKISWYLEVIFSSQYPTKTDSNVSLIKLLKSLYFGFSQNRSDVVVGKFLNKLL